MKKDIAIFLIALVIFGGFLARGAATASCPYEEVCQH